MAHTCTSCGKEYDKPSDGTPEYCPDCIAAAAQGTEVVSRSTPAGDTDVTLPMHGAGPPPAARPTARAQSRDSVVHAPDGSLKSIAGMDLVRQLGHGAMGTVYEGYQTELQRSVAVKVMRAGEHASDSDIVRFKNEATACARLNHENIVAAYDVGEASGLHYFVMELVDGETLDAWQRRTERSYRERTAMLVAIARAVHHAHENGIIHRDLKPGNAMVDSRGRPRVMDFGLARSTSVQGGLTLSGTAVGTPSYMPPEQAQGRLSEIDARSDVWSLGAIMYELLTGRPPFTGENVLLVLHAVAYDDPVPPRQIDPNVPRDLEAICLKCLEKPGARRYGSAAELADDLKRWLDGETVMARPASIVYRVRKKVARHRAVAAVSAAAAIALVGLFVWSYVRIMHERDTALVAQKREAGLRGQAEHQERIAQDRLLEVQHARKREAAERQRAKEISEKKYGVAIFSEDFEEHSTGDAPGGWVTRTEGDGGSTLTTRFATSGKQSYLVSSTPEWSADFHTSIDADGYEAVEVRLSALAPSGPRGASGGVFLADANGEYLAQLQWRGENLWAGPYRIDSFSRDGWHHLRIRLYPNDKRIDIWLDEVLAAQGILAQKRGFPRRLHIHAGQGGDTYFDDIEVRAWRSWEPRTARTERQWVPIVRECRIGFRLEWSDTRQMSGAAIADLNGDGRDDLAVGCFPGRLILMSWDGTGYVEEWAADFPDCDQVFPATGDVDGDGQQELIVTTRGVQRDVHPTDVIVYGCTRDHELRERWRTRLPRGAVRDSLAIDVGDVDGDGTAEIIVPLGFYGRTLFMMKPGPGNGKLHVTPLLRGNDFRTVRVADTNSDGTNELVLGTGAWSLFDARVYTIHNSRMQLEWHSEKLGVVELDVGDLTGDPRPEIAVAVCPSGGHEDGGVRVFAKSGDVFRQTAHLQGPGAVSPVIGSLLPDERNLLAFAGTMGREEFDAKVYICEIEGLNLNVLWQADMEAIQKASTVSLSIGDPDGDNRNELVITQQYRGLFIYEFGR